MSINDDNPEEVKKAKRKTVWLGYGGTGAGADPGAFQPTNLRVDPSIFDWLLKLFDRKRRKAPRTADPQKDEP